MPHVLSYAAPRVSADGTAIIYERREHHFEAHGRASAQFLKDQFLGEGAVRLDGKTFRRGFISLKAFEMPQPAPLLPPFDQPLDYELDS